MEKKDYTERLISLLEQDHEVISKNATAFEKLTAAVDRLTGGQEQMMNALNLLVAQVTTSISQRNEGVPVRVVLIIVLIMAGLIAAVVGLDLKGMLAEAP